MSPLVSKLCAVALLLPPVSLLAQDDPPTVVLEPVIVSREDAASFSTSLTTAPPELFLPGLALAELPRSAASFDTAELARYGVDGLASLERIGAATARINVFGISGAPTLRGAKAGLYYGGMLRAFTLNEAALPIVAIERIDLVRGVAPAHLTPTHVGGYVNYYPLAPRSNASSLDLTAGSDGHYATRADHQGRLGEGTAYRVLGYYLREDGYYDDVDTEQGVLFASLSAQLTPSLSLFTGFEASRTQTHENAGWNRVTQELIDSGRYLIGEPPLLTSPDWGGNAVRTLLEFPSSIRLNPALHALAIPGEIAREQIPDDLRALMLDLNDPDQTASLYQLQPGIDDPRTQAALDQVTVSTQDTYVYTPEFFAAGGEPLTTPLGDRRTLADPRDYADNTNGLLFADFHALIDTERTLTLKLFAESLETEKLSSYGYAIETDQALAAAKLLYDDPSSVPHSQLQLSASARYTSASMRQDFFAEPFNRRDLARPTISPNSTILAGPQRGPDGQNFWSPAGGANVSSILRQFAAAAQLKTDWHARIHTLAAIRAEYAGFNVGLPGGIDRATPALREQLSSGTGSKSHLSGSLAIVFKLLLHQERTLNLYANAQQGTSMDLTQGGGIFGEESFGQAQLLETGLKGSFLRERLTLGFAAFQWEQTRFSDRDQQTEPLEGEGLELEAAYRILPDLRLSLAADLIEVRRTTPLGFRSQPRSTEELVLGAGVLNSGPQNSLPANNPDLQYPGFPERNFKLLLDYAPADGPNGWLALRWQDSFWLNFDRTIEVPSAWILDLGVGYRWRNLSFGLRLENALDERYFFGSDPIFANNALVTPAPGRRWFLDFTVRL